MPLRRRSPPAYLALRANWSVDSEDERKRGIELGRAAIAKVRGIRGAGHRWRRCGFSRRGVQEGLSAIERSVSLNPNSAMALADAGWVRCYLWASTRSDPRLRALRRLSPREVTLFRMQARVPLAPFLLEEFEEAVSGNGEHWTATRSTRRSIGRWPVLARLGRIDEARGVANDFSIWYRIPLLSLSGPSSANRETAPPPEWPAPRRFT